MFYFVGWLRRRQMGLLGGSAVVCVFLPWFLLYLPVFRLAETNCGCSLPRWKLWLLGKLKAVGKEYTAPLFLNERQIRLGDLFL